MTKLKEILRIKEDVIFGGAIQADWYYDDRGTIAAQNFVFHGPNYFGVLEDEVEFTSHKLIDTCSFAENLAKKIATDEGNPISLAIAGYGTGKSHLAVTLGKLFSNPATNLSNKILSNIRVADSKISGYIKESLNKPNFCIMLNGMKDFNLNYEIIKNVKKTLKDNGYDDEFLAEFTKAYNIASTFVERNFDRFKDEFSNLAKKNNIESNDLKKHLLDNIYKDEIFNLINELYKEITGDYIRWDEGVTAAEVLKKLSEKLCGDNLPFNKIIIFFDEFGRYLEYVSAYPSRAGDAALQQIYDIVTASENTILLAVFIQSDLKTYLARVSKSSNVSRFIGRYESGEKLYLSSNIETIFANIIEKYNSSAFDHFVKGYINNGERSLKYDVLFNNLIKWTENNKRKGLWSDKDKFKKVIVEGIYPFHPLTTYLLTALSGWYQQRSALQFLIGSFKYIENKEVNELGDLPQVYAIDLLKGDFFKELLLAEEEGRQKSEYCSIYDKVIAKHDEKTNTYDKDILTAVLALKLTKFRASSKGNLLFLLESLTGHNEKIILSSIEELENNVGVLGYDEKNYTYDFVEDATGINDFNRFIRKKKQELTIPFNVMINESVLEKVGISQSIKPDFGSKNNIKTSEWQFEQQLIPIDNINLIYIESFIKELNQKTSVDKAKGRIVYIYFNNEYSDAHIDKLLKLYIKYKLKQYPIIFVFLDDTEREFEEAIIANTLINKFTQEDKIKFSKFIVKYTNNNEDKLKEVFRDLIKDKQVVEGNKLEKVEKRISIYCNDILDNLYPYIIPFSFDGFDAKTVTNAKKYYLNICSWLLSGSGVNEQGYHLLAKEVKNRAETVLRSGVTGWGVLDSKFNFNYPVNHKVKRLFDELNDEFTSTTEISIGKYYNKYIKSPYGLNDYSFTLLILSYLLYQGNTAKIVNGARKLKLQEWAVSIFTDKAINLTPLKESTIVKVEIEGYFLKYVDICERIEKNNDISVFKDLYTELEKLLMENDPPEDLVSRIDGIKIRAEQGKRTYEKKERDIAQIKGNLERAIEDQEYKLLIATIKNCNNMLLENDEINSFRITENQEIEITKILDKAHNLIEKNYLQFLKKTSCQNITQLTGFEKWMKLLRDDLRSLHYETFANATQNRLMEVIDNMDTLKEMQMVVETTNKFLNINKPNQYTGQEELISWNDELIRLIDYINSSSLVEQFRKKELCRKLQERAIEIKKCTDGINESMSEIFDAAFELNTVIDCSELINSIELVLSKKLREKDKIDILEIGNILQNFMRENKELESDINLKIRREKFVILTEKYSDLDIIDLTNVIDNYIDGIDKKLEESNRFWVEKHLSIEKSEIDKWDSFKCSQWINETERVPYYLTEANIERYKAIYEQVINRRKQLKVESIIDIFSTLKIDEKKSCIEELTKLTM
ncbi:hypothetical protein [Clostridium sp. FP1]|uniref:hypothetical protein n=1 Tax=Clostridium sp. FP1 TaxID=2724076 RepID=UPI0013E98EF2|nr:hypothetical protein [Clostridium sp. FP1]MBZ9634606.1 hypothetical protein [Clostridium sp. FP1]